MRIVDFPAARHAQVKGYRAEAERARAYGFTDYGKIVADANLWEIAELYWVTQDMTQVALDAAWDMPSWHPWELVPTDVGVLFFDGGLPPLPFVALDDDDLPVGSFGTPYRPDVTVDYIRWWRIGNTLHTDFGCLRHRATYREYDYKSAFISMGEIFIDAVPGKYFEPRGTLEGVSDEDMYKLRVLFTLGATWALMQQENVATTHRAMHEPGKTERRRGVLPTAVTTVSLRRLRSVDESPVGGSGRKYTHRWIVRGHWRQAAVGPGRAQRRPVWIPSYIKGNPEHPLIQTEKVNVWRR